MQYSKIGICRWLVTIYLMAHLTVTNLKEVSCLKLIRDLGITQKLAWHMNHCLCKAFKQEDPELLGGIVEVDET